MNVSIKKISIKYAAIYLITTFITIHAGAVRAPHDSGSNLPDLRYGNKQILNECLARLKKDYTILKASIKHRTKSGIEALSDEQEKKIYFYLNEDFSKSGEKQYGLNQRIHSFIEISNILDKYDVHYELSFDELIVRAQIVYRFLRDYHENAEDRSYTFAGQLEKFSDILNNLTAGGQMRNYKFEQLMNTALVEFGPPPRRIDGQRKGI